MAGPLSMQEKRMKLRSLICFGLWNHTLAGAPGKCGTICTIVGNQGEIPRAKTPAAQV